MPLPSWSRSALATCNVQTAAPRIRMIAFLIISICTLEYEGLKSHIQYIDVLDHRKSMSLQEIYACKN